MKKKDWLYIGIIIIFGFILYANSLNNSFVWDDKEHIEKNDFIKDWNNLPSLFTPGYFELTNEGFALSWRPLTTLSYFISYSLWGINPLGYRWASIINHLLNAVLVYLITSILFRKRNISFMAGLFFIAHPINTEAVCGISFNENLLACLFLLGAFYLYVKTQNDKKSQKIRIFLWGISCLFYLLALLSKEVAISLPLIILAYDYCFAPEKDMRKRYFFYLGYAGITLFYLGIRFFVLQDIQNIFFSNLIKKDFLSVGLVEIIASLVYFLKLLVLPVNLCAVPLISTPGSLFGARGLGLIVAIIIIGVFNFFIYKYSKKVFWSLLWIFLNLLPILSIIPFYYLFSERYLYIPSIGFAMLLAIGIDKCIQTKRLSMAVLIFLLVFYSWTTVKRNSDWKDDLTLWSRTVKMYPNNCQAHNNLGCVYNEQGKYDEACREYKKALELVPHYLASWLNLGNVYMLKGEYYKAIKAVKEVLKLNPNHSGAHSNLGVYYSKIGLYNQAMQEYKKVLELNPGAGVYKNIGDLYRQQGLEEKAVKAYKYALRLNPQYVEARKCLSFYGEKDEKDEIKKIIYFYKRIRMINSQILNKMNFKLAKNQPYLQGEIEKYLLEDNMGNRWMFETYPSYALNVAQVQEAIYYFALICGIDLPQLHCLSLPINGKLMFGSIQRFLPDMSSFCDMPTKKLGTHQVNYIQKQHIFDWFILNHDSTKDNFLISKEAKIVGIDKDSAFNLLN
ncbi:tetratricopeptide repeat protein, partial [bacterium]|nr:tetratricopeptide repeat protein [bacterium]